MIVKTVFRIVICLSVILTAVFSIADSQTPLEEARRHFNRGMAAVEMAKDPTGYDFAIEEFQKAQALAPDWPDVYYNLGLIQEKAGRFKDAAGSLRQYLRLSPNSPDAETIRTMVDKLEFKAEQVITDDEALDIFASLKDTSKWQLKAITNAKLLDSFGWIRSLSRGSRPGNQGRLVFEFVSGSGCPDNRGICPGDALPIGKTIEFETLFINDLDGKYMSFYHFRLEVVSRNKVTMTVRAKRKGFAVETEDASGEFVRR